MSRFIAAICLLSLSIECRALGARLGASPDDYDAWARSEKGWEETKADSPLTNLQVLVFSKMTSGGITRDPFGRWQEKERETIAQRAVLFENGKSVCEVWTINSNLDLDEVEEAVSSISGSAAASLRLQRMSQASDSPLGPVAKACYELARSNSTSWTNASISADSFKRPNAQSGWTSLNLAGRGVITGAWKGTSSKGTAYYLVKEQGFTTTRFCVGELPLVQGLTGFSPSAPKPDADAEKKAPTK